MSSKAAGKKRANPRDEDTAMLEAQEEEARAVAADSSDEDDDDDDDEFEEDSDDDEEIVDGGEEGEEGVMRDGCNAETEGRLWRAGDTLAEGETLEFDSSAYDMLRGRASCSGSSWRARRSSPGH